MRTILPQNTTLSRANTVTVDAERFAQLNTLTDIELRQKLGEAMARLVKTYIAHVLKENPNFTVGQALEVVKMMADDVRDFAGIDTENVDEYDPKMFPILPESNSSDQSAAAQDSSDQDDESSGDAGDNINNVQGMSADERRNRLFNSFGRNRNRPPRR